MSNINLEKIKDIKDFKKKFKKGLWFIRLHAVWCGHCLAMKEEWEKFVSNSKFKHIHIVSIRDDIYNKYLEDIGIQNIGYPTIQMYRDGKLEKEFNYNRTEEGFKKFLSEFDKEKKKTKTKPKKKKLKAKTKKLKPKPKNN